MCPKRCWQNGKQCYPDHVAPLEAVWSGSALFAQTCLSKNLGSLHYGNPNFLHYDFNEEEKAGKYSYLFLKNIISVVDHNPP